MYPYTIYHVFIDDALGSPIGAFRCTDPIPVPGLALKEHGEACTGEQNRCGGDGWHSQDIDVATAHR